MNRTWFKIGFQRWRGMLLIFTLLFCVAIASGVPQSIAAHTPAAPAPPNPTPLVPNVEPEESELAELVATASVTDTVTAVLAEFNKLPQPATPPEGALLRLPNSNRTATTASFTLVYIPMLMGRTDVAPAPEPTPRPDPDNRGPAADVAVVIWPTPSIWVARGATLAYEIRLENRGSGVMKNARVTLPYNRQQFTLTGTRLFTSKGDWVSNISDDQFTVTFGELAAGARRAGTVYLRVAGNLAHATVISERASYDWSDEQGGGTNTTNWAPVLVGSGNVDGQWLWLEVKPVEGRVGTTHGFFTDRFLPGEEVVTWLNTPDGVRSLDLRSTADKDGRVWLEFSSWNRRPGNYSLVIYGLRSHLTAVDAFVVKR